MNILDTIGRTPLILLDNISRELPARIWVKNESRNPGGSIKDRAALGYIEAALASGALAPGGTVVEATSGNLGIGLAVVCAKKGLRLILTVPASASQERISLLRAMGAEVMLTPAELGMQGAQDKADELLASCRRRRSRDWLYVRNVQEARSRVQYRRIDRQGPYLGRIVNSS